MQDPLLGLPLSERESLVRFYVQGHDDQQICRELRMPAAEFRSLKVRVKARFHEACEQCAIGITQTQFGLVKSLAKARLWRTLTGDSRTHACERRSGTAL